MEFIVRTHAENPTLMHAKNVACDSKVEPQATVLAGELLGCSSDLRRGLRVISNQSRASFDHTTLTFRDGYCPSRIETSVVHPRNCWKRDENCLTDWVTYGCGGCGVTLKSITFRPTQGGRRTCAKSARLVVAITWIISAVLPNVGVKTHCMCFAINAGKCFNQIDN